MLTIEIKICQMKIEKKKTTYEYVPACQRYLDVNVLVCQRGVRANMPPCQRAKNMPTFSFYVPACQ